MPLHTIGIIGGTDSPTEILLSGKRSIWELAAGVIFAAVIIGIILFIRKKIHNKDCTPPGFIARRSRFFNSQISLRCASSFPGWADDRGSAPRTDRTQRTRWQCAPA